MNRPPELPDAPTSHEDRTDIYVMEAPAPCLLHGTHHLVTVPLDGLRNYHRFFYTPGHYIQDANALGCLTPERRELLMSGMCQEAWDDWDEGGEDDLDPIATRGEG